MESFSNAIEWGSNNVLNFKTSSDVFQLIDRLADLLVDDKETYELPIKSIQKNSGIIWYLFNCTKREREHHNHNISETDIQKLNKVLMDILNKIKNNYVFYYKPVKIQLVSVDISPKFNVTYVTTTEFVKKDNINNIDTDVGSFTIIDPIKKDNDPKQDDVEKLNNAFAKLGIQEKEEKDKECDNSDKSINTIKTMLEIVFAVKSLVANLNKKDMISSNVTSIIQDFEGEIQLILTDNPEQINSLDEVNKCLKENSWNFPGFNSPPDKDKLLVGIEAVLNRMRIE